MSNLTPEVSHRQAPNMMQGMPVPPPARANPSRRGIAWDICRQTPSRLQVEYHADQRQYPRCPKLAGPQVVLGFVVEMGRKYYKQTVALREAQHQ